MQRTLSTNKLKGINSKQEHKRMGEDKKKKKIIYVPILYDNPFIPHRGSDHTQRSDTVQYQHRPPHLPYPQANGGYPMQHYPLNYSQTQRKEYL